MCAVLTTRKFAFIKNETHKIMKTNSTRATTALLFVLLTFASCSNDKETINDTENISFPQKYGVKSGTITYEVVVQVGAITDVTQNVLYFDDYGITERIDIIEDGILKSSNLAIKNGRRYQLNHTKKTYLDIDTNSRGWEYKVDWNEVSERSKADGTAKKLPNETHLGKDCETYTYSTTKYSGWEGILLFQQQKSFTKTATGFEEGDVPADTFKIPTDYTKP